MLPENQESATDDHLTSVARRITVSARVMMIGKLELAVVVSHPPARIINERANTLLTVVGFQSERFRRWARKAIEP